MERERYRVPGRREKRTLAEEVSKFSLCFALSEHGRALKAKGRARSLSGMDVASIKAGILGEAIRAGDEIEGEAVTSAFAAVYTPRAYYPAYLLGEMRAALRRGEDPPSASPHYLPVSTLPALPGGSRIVFVYGTEKTSFDRPDFPAHVRDVLTRDFQRLPLLVPPGNEIPEGRIRFRVRLLQVDRDSAYRFAGMGDGSYEAYSARGLMHFLAPLETEVVDAAPPLRGALFAELSFADEPSWEGVEETLEGTVRGVVEEVFPPCTRGEREEPGCYLPHSGFHVSRFRRRLYALVYDPVIVVFRAPRLLGLYLPGQLAGEKGGTEALFDEFTLRLAEGVEERLGLRVPLKVELAYDNLRPWARDREALRGPSFDNLVEEHPFLGPTLEWLRGESAPPNGTGREA